ncbi:hypothetical protein [Streptomyces sp. cg35]|uniref:hypothetical protein n=1 Tax=Streptomyces sp. cg35 TaxID=3421650 RepID=UPI003D177221
MDGEHWLASCHPTPDAAYTQWEQPPHLAEIPLGRRFDALRLPQMLGLTLLWELARDRSRIPVLEEHARPKPWIYVLAEPGTAEAWGTRRRQSGATILSAGDTLTVPSPLADAITGVQRHHRYMWRTAPNGAGTLAASDDLATALDRALDPDRQAERIRAARAVFFKGRHRTD